jgi:hypothetical protein
MLPTKVEFHFANFISGICPDILHEDIAGESRGHQKDNNSGEEKA